MTVPQIRVVSWADEQARLVAIRREVFILEQGVPEVLEWDELDSSAEHFLAMAASGNAAVGTARLLPSGQIGRIAVLRDWRRQGIGTELLRACLARAAALGMAEVFLHAQLTAVPLYTAQGFQVEGGTFLEAGIPHLLMRRALL